MGRTDETLIYFGALGIPNMFSLGKIEMLKSQPPIEPHVHKDRFEICVHYAGRQYYEINRKGYETRSGNIFLSFPNEHHSSGNRREERSKFFYLIFECTKNTKNFIGLSDDESKYIVEKLFSVRTRLLPGAMIVRPILDEIIKMHLSDHPLRIPRVYSRVIDFFYEICALIDCSAEIPPMPQDIDFICEYLDAHITETPLISDLATKIFLSRSNFIRKFKKHTNYTPHDYIMCNKINLAKEMLRYTYMPITQIAQELGISSSQAFSGIFKKYTGMTPREFRNNRRTSH